MSSLGASPTSISLLIPPNPSFASVDLAPRGGILLNARRESDASNPGSPALQALRIETNSPEQRRVSAPSENGGPISPVEFTSPSLISPAGQVKIRFAPLPDPRRPRSLSTGRNVIQPIREDENGERRRTLEIRGVESGAIYDDEVALVDADEDVSEWDEDTGDKKRRWSKTMTMGMSTGTIPGLRGTMKLLGMKDDKKEEKNQEGYSEGAPLKKSVSTGGFIGSSPFRMALETERKRSMQGVSAPTLSPRAEFGSHRRTSSYEVAPSGSLGSSPQPIKMLNGRVYGGRRASEAAERERQYRARIEPTFVEWGNGHSGGGLGRKPGGGRAFLGDADEGSGMEWVKRRREERQKRKEEEERLAAESRAGGVQFTETTLENSSPRSSASASPDTGTNLMTPQSTSTTLPPTPIIQISEHQSPAAEKTLSGMEDRMGTSAPGKMEEQRREHTTHAIQVPRRSQQQGRDVFDDNNGSSDIDDDEEEEGESEEEEDEGDFSEDEEEDEAIRTTSSAAGVEVVSRHRD